MISNTDILLSVMVISHNQVHLIGRCIDSILAQKIRVPWEIVISDDNSTDGTWEWVQEFAKQAHEPRVVISQINSSDYNPTVTSDRCAVNKANAYSHASGKYCVNIDADDYLLGDDIYQYQIDQLEAHPECTMALQNIWYQNDGEPIEKGHPWHYDGFLKENEILTMQDYCQRRMFTSNPAFMMRRDPNLNPMEKYGLLFDDNIISMHHIVQGKIICSAKAQYVYVQYKSSIWNQVELYPKDMAVRVIMSYVIYCSFFNKFNHEILDLMNNDLITALKTCRGVLNLSPSYNGYCQRNGDSFIIQKINNRLIGRIRSCGALKVLLFRNKYCKNTIINRVIKMIL